MSFVEIETTVIVLTKARCPKCKKTLERGMKFSREEVIAAKYDVLKHALKECEGDIAESIDKRGWSRALCGRCRDADAGDPSGQTEKPWEAAER